jgi:hypothetical protein
MNLIFPTYTPFPSYPTRPTEEDEAAATAFLQALFEFFRHLQQQHTSTTRYFDAAHYYFDQSNQESTERTQSAGVTQEAISAVIKNIHRPSIGEYVWVSAQNCWVLILVTL